MDPRAFFSSPHPRGASDPDGATALRDLTESQAALLASLTAAAATRETAAPTPLAPVLEALAKTLRDILAHPAMRGDAFAQRLVERMAGAADMDEVAALVDELDARIRKPPTGRADRGESAAPSRSRLLFKL